MNEIRTATVFFDIDPSEETAKVNEKLQRGIDAIREHISGLPFVNSNDFSRTASFYGSADAIARLQQFVEETRLGTVELDGPKLGIFLDGKT